ncbi:MAG: hypothetical protein U1E76_07280 [Planctomycetota bacterium]
MQRTHILLLALLAAARPAFAKTWIVAKDGSGDFTQVQPAIDAAQPGDVIVVREGTYGRIMVTKGVAIVGVGIGRTIIQQPGGDGHDALGVTAVPKVQRTIVANLTLEATSIAWVYESPGTFVCHRVELKGQPWDGSWGYNLASWHSGPTFVDQCYTTESTDDPNWWYYKGTGGFHAKNATMSVVNCQSYPPQQDFLLDGSPAFRVYDSGTLFLAESTGTGGIGATGFYGGAYCEQMTPGGRGGAGAFVGDGCDAIVAGRAHLLRGGEGGPGGKNGYCSGMGEGGPGGDGVRVEGSGAALVSNIVAEGAPGGHGDPDGAPGVPYFGNVMPAPTPLPTSLMSGSSTIGGDFTLTFYGATGDQVLLVISDQVGVVKVKGTDGFPLMAIPGGFFAARPLGAIDSSGQLALVFPIPSDERLRGYAVFAQGIVTSPTLAHPPQITNLSLSVIAEP